MYSYSYYQFPSDEVLTEFHYDKQTFFHHSSEGEKQGVIDDAESGTANYTSYDLYCFNTKLRDKILDINLNLSHKLIPKEYNNKIYLTVELNYGYYRVPIYDPIALTNMVKLSHIEVPNKFLFFSCNRDLYIDGQNIPSIWIKNIITEISLPQAIDYNTLQLFDLSPEIIDNKVYITLNPDTNYRDDYIELKRKFLRYLSDLYKRGAVVSTNNQLVKDWNLNRIQGNLYEAQWNNILFARNKTTFLMKLLLGSKTINIDIPNDNIVKDHIARKLNYNFFFTNSTITIFVQSLDQATEATAVVAKYLRSFEGNVNVIPFYERKDDEQGISYETTEGRVVSYHT